MLVTLTADGGGYSLRVRIPAWASRRRICPRSLTAFTRLARAAGGSPGPVHRAGHGAPARRSRHCPAAGAGGHLLRRSALPSGTERRWADETTHRGAGLSAGSGRRGPRPRPEEPEGGYCVYYSALSDRFAPLPLDCEPLRAPATPSLPWWTPCCPPPGDPGPRPPSPRGGAPVELGTGGGPPPPGPLRAVRRPVRGGSHRGRRLPDPYAVPGGGRSRSVTVEGREIPYRRVQQLGPDGLFAHRRHRCAAGGAGAQSHPARLLTRAGRGV